MGGGQEQRSQNRCFQRPAESATCEPGRGRYATPHWLDCPPPPADVAKARPVVIAPARPRLVSIRQRSAAGRWTRRRGWRTGTGSAATVAIRRARERRERVVAERGRRGQRGEEHRHPYEPERPLRHRAALRCECEPDRQRQHHKTAALARRPSRLLLDATRTLRSPAWGTSHVRFFVKQKRVVQGEVLAARVDLANPIVRRPAPASIGDGSGRSLRRRGDSATRCRAGESFRGSGLSI